MILQAIAFYLFAGVTVASAVMVVFSRNPVNSVLFLILAFFNAAGLFVLLGAEFIAMILVIVYVGAVAVLFLFVVMMLNIDYKAMREGFVSNAPIGVIIGFILIVELVLVMGGWTMTAPTNITGSTPIPPINEVTNAQALGQVLYTKYIYLFQAAGMILLLAMVGAIVLTLRTRPGVKRQTVADQISKGHMDTVSVRKVPSRSGV
jgi:NADH-quinone oxidoreductase subunit J